METHDSTSWTIGIFAVAMAKNMRVNKTTGCAPYTLLYGQTPRKASSKLPFDKKLLAELKTEADLEKIIGQKLEVTNRFTTSTDANEDDDSDDEDNNYDSEDDPNICAFKAKISSITFPNEELRDSEFQEFALSSIAKVNEIARTDVVELTEDMNDPCDDEDSFFNPMVDIAHNDNLISSVDLAQECITINDDPTKDDEYYEDFDGNLVKHPGEGFTKWMNVTLSIYPTLPLELLLPEMLKLMI